MSRQWVYCLFKSLDERNSASCFIKHHQGVWKLSKAILMLVVWIRLDVCSSSFKNHQIELWKCSCLFFCSVCLRLTQARRALTHWMLSQHLFSAAKHFWAEMVVKGRNHWPKQWCWIGTSPVVQFDCSASVLCTQCGWTTTVKCVS